MITIPRFKMALQQLSGSDWAAFEQLASVFLAADFPELRVMAAPSGDGGRDSELYSPSGISSVAIQYSVQEGWKAKVDSTIKRLTLSFPTVTNLVYVTNQDVGPSADAVKADLLRGGHSLDVRDLSWFLARAHADPARATAAEHLAQAMVDPLMRSREIDRGLVVGLPDAEARSALMFLEMQYKDTTGDYNLTKSSFDALVKAALRDTHTESRISRSDVHEYVKRLLPQHPGSDLIPRIDASLARLSGKSIRLRKDKDEFHLLDEERTRLVDAAAIIDGLKSALDDDIVETVSAIPTITVNDPKEFARGARGALERYYLKKGEEFAQAVVKGDATTIHITDLKDAVLSIAANLKVRISGRSKSDLLFDVITTVLATSSEKTNTYLQLLTNSYTLFAFLATTPDVQRATRKMFGSGEFWLDTSVLLPVLAEIAQNDTKRPFTAMFKQARACGVKLYATQGVVEEIASHIRLCRTYARSEVWHGMAPYLYTAYALSGKPGSLFTSWLENFVGAEDPVQDVADFLFTRVGVSVRDAQDHSHVSDELAREIRDIWRDIQHARRKDSDFNLQSNRLAEHDSENYLHVLSSRIAQRGRAPLGYSDWWITTDSAARTILFKVSAELRPDVKTGPVLSLDFLLRYLAFGPNRERADMSEAALAQFYTGEVLNALPEDLLAVANEVRTENAHLPDNIVQRRIRDRLNSERARVGRLDAAGLEGASAAIDKSY